MDADIFFERDFASLPSSITVEDARLHPVSFAIVHDDAGKPLTLLDMPTLSFWDNNESLGAMQYSWPPLYTLHETEAKNIIAVARFFRSDLLNQPSVPGIVVVDDEGSSTAIIARDVLINVETLTIKEKLDLTEEQVYIDRDTLWNDAAEQFTEQTSEALEADKETDYTVDLTPEKELQVKRFGQLQFPAQTSLHSPCQLTIAIYREQIPGLSNQVELSLTNRDWPLKVVVTLLKVSPEDFLIQGASYGIIEVPRDADSLLLSFTLIPQSAGKKVIYVLFEQIGEARHNYVAMTSIETEVVATTVEQPARAEIRHWPKIVSAASSPDVTIYILHNEGLGYSMRVRTAEDKEGSEPRLIDTIIFPQPPDAYLKEIFDALDEKTSAGLTDLEFDNEVKIIGNNLYNKLFHEDGFKAFYWNYMHQLPPEATIQIISDEPYIPWEILLPFHLKDGHWESEISFLCQRFTLSRWLTGPQCGDKLPLLKAVLVAPPSDLQWSDSEVKAITKMPGLSVTNITEKQQLEEFFQKGQADVVHFACHGAFKTNNPGQSFLLLGNRTLRPDDLVAENRNFAVAQPLVFLNACDSGRQGIGLTNLDGWAKAFLEAGVGFFIGSVWKTDDRLAYEFANSFYTRLCAGDSVGEAMKKARLAAFLRGDASYLSYTLYANPRIHARSM
jgi:hypothetical protein